MTTSQVIEFFNGIGHCCMMHLQIIGAVHMFYSNGTSHQLFLADVSGLFEDKFQVQSFILIGC